VYGNVLITSIVFRSVQFDLFDHNGVAALGHRVEMQSSKRLCKKYFEMKYTFSAKHPPAVELIVYTSSAAHNVICMTRGVSTSWYAWEITGAGDR